MNRIYRSEVFIIIFIYLLSVIQPIKAYSVYDPLSVPNNKYGIHIIDENDLENAADLVNSSNGDWGYVTMVITENDRNEAKWNSIFSRMGKYHLIPIIRIATKVIGESWEKPDKNEILPWLNFLNGLNWPVKNRYVILFNEPNHAKEYGGIIDPQDYSDIVVAFSRELKNKSPDFFVLMAGFDASAPSGPETMDEKVYLYRMISQNNDIFDNIDAWVSHSYPNPGFSGSVTDSGRGTLRTYKWELNTLKSLGIDKILSVFITETGWVHAEGDSPNKYYYSSDEVSALITRASKIVWNDPSIVAITPFVLNYPVFPFSHFSWTAPDGNSVYPQYDAYRSIPKIHGQPILYYPDIIYPSPEVYGVKTEITPKNNKTSGLQDSIIIFYSKFISLLNRIKI